MPAFRLAWLLLITLLALGCMPRYQYMTRARDATYPGSRGEAARFEERFRAWTRVEPLGLRSTASVTMYDPSLAADDLAARASAEQREVGPAEQARWEELYGERHERMPFEVKWRFDKLFQPQRVTDPRVGWTFVLRDDHGRSWPPLALEQVEQGEDQGAWTGSFWLYFPTHDQLIGPLYDGRTRKLTLRVTGEPGAADFSWRFAPDPGALEEPWPDRR